MSSRSESDLLDRVEMALLSNLVNRALHDHACMEAAKQALDKVKAREQKYGGLAKKRVFKNVVEALKTVG